MAYACASCLQGASAAWSASPASGHDVFRPVGDPAMIAMYNELQDQDHAAPAQAPAAAAGSLAAAPYPIAPYPAGPALGMLPPAGMPYGSPTMPGAMDAAAGVVPAYLPPDMSQAAQQASV